MRAWDHQRVATRGGRDVHEGDRPLVFVDDRRGQLAREDLAEDAIGVGHRRKPIRIVPRGRLRRALGRQSACSRVATSPAYCASASSSSSSPDPRARGDAAARAPARRRATAATVGPGAPAQRVGEHRRATPGARRSTPARDRRASPGDRRPTAASRRPRPASRCAGSRTRSCARERLRLVHEEAEPQVIAHQRRHVRAESLARAQPAEHLAREGCARARRGR